MAVAHDGNSTDSPKRPNTSSPRSEALLASQSTTKRNPAPRPERRPGGHALQRTGLMVRHDSTRKAGPTGSPGAIGRQVPGQQAPVVFFS